LAQAWNIRIGISIPGLDGKRKKTVGPHATMVVPLIESAFEKAKNPGDSPPGVFVSHIAGERISPSIYSAP
jgi:hypothetical protein